jgi:ATP-binding cassette, subfamily C (CFTR/MRP), member 1
VGRCRADLWLAAWIKDVFDRSIGFYIVVFLSLGGVRLGMAVLAGIAQAVGTSNAASTLHERAVHRVLRAPASFFDTTPLGRIINR